VLPPVDLSKLPPKALEYLKQQVYAECWRRGELEYKLHSTQKRIRAALAASTRRKFFLLCSRRLGKSFTLLCLALETAIKKPGARILYLAPLASAANEIVVDGLRPILADVPASLGLEVKEHAKEIRFANGSLIRLKGVNSEHADNLRGGAQDLVILDECGQMDRLEYVLGSIVMPMTMTTGGKIILATTPADTPDHDSTKIYQDLSDSGDAVKFTLMDAPEEHIPLKTKREYLLEAKEKREDLDAILAGKLEPQGTTALREYWCSFVTDANKAVIPEMREAARHIIKVQARDDLFDAYVSVDPGQTDKTGIVFCTYSFKQGVIIVEDEALLHRASTNDVARVVLDKEWQLWRNQKPYVRVVDDDLRMIGDLRELHGLSFVPATKPNATAAMNLLRTMIGNHEIIIDPKCVHLIEHLKNAIWNNRATSMARVGDGGEDSHHFDLVDALKYCVRAINRMRNPYPADYRPIGGVNGVWRSPKTRFRGESVSATQHVDLMGKGPVGNRLRKRRWKLG
jgi:hypothetical protein